MSGCGPKPKLNFFAVSTARARLRPGKAKTRPAVAASFSDGAIQIMGLNGAYSARQARQSQSVSTEGMRNLFLLDVAGAFVRHFGPVCGEWVGGTGA
jgi:hypothetical protein